ncbi:brachyurin-like [Tribolium madens]|uniref:brachyurin-like n=1 Tax=Tribolium madens TaxID=41895 RepID=UPI001CF71EFD|nr:brachyurin-like [Tribolium madens]
MRVFLLIFLSQSSISATNLKIIGGDDALAGQFPFAAAIYVRTNDGTYFCGGTLISDEWILTAGQCVHEAVSFTIQLGSSTLAGNDPNRVKVSTSESVIHPNFDPISLQNDIGLIKLRLPVEYNDYVRQIRFLPTFRLQDGASTIAIGWGQISDDNSGLSNVLQRVNLTTISTDECKLTYGGQITEDMVCVNGNYNEGSCTGDMGSPLLQHVGRGYYLVVGVASFISGNGCESTDPSGYTRTFSYINWVKNITNI